MDPNQHVAIYCVDQALQSLANSNINRERTAVIMNIGAPGIRYNNIIRRTYYAKIEHYLRNNPKLNESLKKRNWMRCSMGFQIWPLQVQFQLPRTVRRDASEYYGFKDFQSV